MADPGFPRGAPTPEVDVITYYFEKKFAENCILIKEFEPMVRPFPAPGSANDSDSFITMFSLICNCRLHYHQGL